MRVVRGRILVIRGGAIGDFILTLPAIAALRNQFPEAHLEVLGYPHIAQLALAGGVVDRMQPIEARELAGFFSALGVVDAVTADYFARFDIIVSYLFDPDLIFQTNVAKCSRAQFIQGPHRPNEAERIHATQVYLKPLERLAIFDADPVPRIGVAQASLPADSGRILAPGSGQPNQSHLGKDAQVTRRLEACATLALHPGSGSDQKNWPEENWAKLMQPIIAETSSNLLLVGGEAEGDRLERLAKNLPRGRVELARSLPLAELATRLAGCSLFVGHDSGISHLAAAVGLPTLVLWGHTVQEIWRPQGSRVAIIHETAGLGALSVDRVWQELIATLNRNRP